MEIALKERTAGPAARPRLAYLDNIRWTIIAMVVLTHACVTYSGLGSWYYREGASLGTAETLVLYVYEFFAQAFFMGLLFFLSAVLTPGSYDRKGFRRFLTDRLVRLGVPTLVYMLVLHPITSLIRDAGLGRPMDPAGVAREYAGYLSSGTFLRESGPLWFAFALLAFSLVYALVRVAARAFRKADSGRSTARPLACSPRDVHIAASALILVLTVGSFLVRLAQPLGTSWMNMQLCNFTQYVVLFLLGLWAGRRGLLETFPRQAGRVWLWLAAAVGAPVWFLLIGLGGAMSGGETLYTGGWHWQAAGLAAWESFFCVAMCLGLLTLYREKANARTGITGLLADTSFGIYVFHAPILVGVTMLLRSLSLDPLAKTALAAAAAWTASVAVAWLVRRIPGVGRLFA
jgi:glucans biosynthesis protein C